MAKCLRCNGLGLIDESDCPRCGGAGDLQADDTDFNFNFNQWEAEQRKKRAARVAELVAAFAAGKTIIETLPGGKVIAWRLGANNFVEPYKNDPAYLARHIEGREYGFGWKLTIHSMTANEHAYIQGHKIGFELSYRDACNTFPTFTHEELEAACRGSVDAAAGDSWHADLILSKNGGQAPEAKR